MKKIILIIIAIGFISTLKAQRTFGDPQKYAPVTSVNSSSTFQLRQNSQTRTITWSTLSGLLSTGSDLLTQPNTWTDNQTFVAAGLILGSSSYLTLPTSYVIGGHRQLYIPSGDSTLYAYIDDTPIRLLTKAEADNLYAIDPTSTEALNSTYMTLSTTQTATGSKVLAGAWNFTNKMKVPAASSFPSTTWYGQIAYNTTTQQIGYSNNGFIFLPLATEAYVIANAVSNVGGVVEDSLQAQSHFFSFSLDYPQSGENIGLFKTPYVMNIQSVNAVVTTDNGGSIKVNVRWGSSRATASEELFYGNELVSSTTGESLTGDIYGTSITADYWVWAVTSELTNTVKNLLVTVEYLRP